MFGDEAPPEILPLYVMVAAIHEAVDGRPNYPNLVANGQVTRALQHLGLSAELIPASALVILPDLKRVDVGVWDRPPNIGDDGSTDGHFVIWVETLNRVVDIGAYRDPAVRPAAQRPTNRRAGASLPVVVAHIPNGRDQLYGQFPFVLRPNSGLGISWMFFPEWRARFEPALAKHAATIEHGAVALARVTVDILSAFAVHRDLRPVEELFPGLGALLAGRRKIGDHCGNSAPGPSTVMGAAQPWGDANGNTEGSAGRSRVGDWYRWLIRSIPMVVGHRT